MLVLQNVSVRRPTGPVLHQVDWTLEPGQHWAVIGPTGSGKTSFLETLSGQLPVISGQYQHTGPLRDTVERVANDYRFDRNVSAAAQFYQQRFNADAAAEAPTVWEVLQEQVRPVGTVDPESVPLPPPRYKEEWLHEVASWTHISHLLQRRLTSLSNGETRRTLLTRSLLRRPKVLLLDNPFTGLDTVSRERLHTTLDRIAAEGTSLILVTTVRDLPASITHVLVLEDGRVTYSGPKAGAPLAGEESHEPLTNPERLREWLERPPVATFANAIAMRQVTVSYGEKVVLNQLDWQVKRGEKWAVLGPNGSGKSTLLSLITADNPQAYRNDYDLFDRKRGQGESIWDIKRNIGFVSPELHLYFPREQPVWKVIASGLFDTAGLFRKLTDEQADRVDFALDLLQIQTLRLKRLADLSTGQQRWVLLARALVKNPPLLVLDEPCQGLDLMHTARFRDLVDELCESPERTLLYVSHYADEIPRCVSQVLRMHEGVGTVEQ